MRYICYLKRNIVFIPTSAQIGVGHYRDVEPVAVVPVADVDRLRRSLREVVTRGNPSAPPLTRNNRPPPVVLKHAGAKTWSAFARGTRPWQIDEQNGNYRIIGMRDSSGGGWEEDPQQTTIFPLGTPLNTVVDCMVEILRAAAKNSNTTT